MRGRGAETPAFTIARALSEDEARSGSVEVLAGAPSYQEAIYVATGGTVCLAADFDPASLTDEILSTPSSPDELKDCADFDLPQPVESTSPETNRALTASD